MPLPALMAACLLRASAAVAVEHDLAVRAEGRVRTVALALAEPQAAREVELDPAAVLTLAEPDRSWTLAYRPRLVASDRPGDPSAVLHTAALAARWQVAQPWQLSAAAEGSYGTVSLLQLQAPASAAGQAPPPAQPVPAVAALRTRRAQVQVGAAGTLDPRLRLRTGLTAFNEGGAGHEAEALLPLQRGLRAELGLDWDATRRDLLTTAFTGARSDFPSGPAVGVATLVERWTRLASPFSRLWLGAGAAATQHRLAGVTTSRLLPSAEAGAGYEDPGPEPARAILALTLAPFVDRILGSASQRATGSATTDLTFRRSWTVSATASGGVVVSGPRKGDRVWSGDVRSGWQHRERISLALGVRGIFQREAGPGAVRTYEWNVYLAATLRDRSGPWPSEPSAPPPAR